MNASSMPLLRQLPAANRLPVSVAPDAEIAEAITIMLAEDFSQLPVMQGEREVKGYINWRSIGEAFATGQNVAYVKECMTGPCKEVPDDLSLLDAVTEIASHDFVLVRGKDRKVIGLVTTSDITQHFHEMAEPFFLLGHIEDHLRALIDAYFSVNEISAAKDPRDEAREVTKAADMTFGEYIRLLENPANWQKLGRARLSRDQMIKYLKELNKIRNQLMHFHPGDMQAESISLLRNFSKLLMQLRPKSS